MRTDPNTLLECEIPFAIFVHGNPLGAQPVWSGREGSRHEFWLPVHPTYRVPRTMYMDWIKGIGFLGFLGYRDIDVA